MPKCQHHLGDAGCGVNLTGSPSYTDTVTVVTNADPWTLTVSGSTQADDYYNLGAMKFTSGNLNGQSYDVRDWTLTGGIIKLARPLRGTAAVSDTATIHAGCDWTTGAAGCARFNNIQRFFGFRHLPDENLDFPVVDEQPPVQQSDPPSGIWF